MNELRKKERELFKEAMLLREMNFEITSKGDPKKTFNRAREIQRKQDELYKKQQFYKKIIREMEK